MVSPEWKFIYISEEKYLQTIWNKIPLEIEDLQYLNITQDAVWNVSRIRSERWIVPEESTFVKVQEDQSRETISKDRPVRPDE